MPAPALVSVLKYVLAFAAEILEHPHMAEAYVASLRPGDNFTLVLYAPDADPSGLQARLERDVPVLSRTDGPDVIILAVPSGREADILTQCAALLTSAAVPLEFASLPAFPPSQLEALRSLVLETPVSVNGPPRVSFCIITGGTRPEIVDQVVRSIQAQNIPEYEVIIAGRHHAGEGFTYVAEEVAAREGRLGRLRNAAVAQASYEHMVVMDDDILLASDWYAAFRAVEAPFDILTSQVRLPDGTRYWDHATIGGPRGQQILAPTEQDAFVYMTGGGGWVMQSRVARAVQWDNDLPLNNGEDVDFSRRCQAHGFVISHAPRMVVYHAAPKYTGIGRWVGLRTRWATHADAHQALAESTSEELLALTNESLSAGLLGDAADCLRIADNRFPDQPRWLSGWHQLEAAMGGALPDNRWYCADDPAYTTLIRHLADWAPTAEAA